MYADFVDYFAKAFEKEAKKDNAEAAKKAAKHIKERLGRLRSGLIRRVFDDLKEETPLAWNPRKKTYSREKFLDEDIPNKKQWDGTDGSDIEDKNKNCKKGMYTTGAACAKGCQGGKCTDGISGGRNPTPYSYCKC